ncbi:MAG: hypothetical protein ABI824_02425 [Acidobacteriota bacterium]
MFRETRDLRGKGSRSDEIEDGLVTEANSQAVIAISNETRRAEVIYFCQGTVLEGDRSHPKSLFFGHMTGKLFGSSNRSSAPRLAEHPEIQHLLKHAVVSDKSGSRFVYKVLHEDAQMLWPSQKVARIWMPT